MKQKLKYISIFLMFVGMFSCEILEPIDENPITLDYIEKTPVRAEGFLMQAYTKLQDQYQFTETATDDAVSNLLDNSYNRMAAGELSSKMNPVNKWAHYERIFYINQFIDIVEKGSAQWSRDTLTNTLFEQRLMGEALALRALFHFYILQAHAGIGVSGQLRGIPYYEEFIQPKGNFNVPRLPFKECVEKISSDFDQALELLPEDYFDEEANVDPKYKEMQGYEIAKYKLVNGKQFKNRISGRIVKALKARLNLFAASPAFLNGSDGYYEAAAKYAAELINELGGVSSLPSDGIEFYINENSEECLWRGVLQAENGDQELRHFPPSLNGRGEVNPTHNLVSAFPMRNGWPATIANGYDPQAPYLNRDIRLSKYILTNGESFGGSYINTGLGGGINSLDSVVNKSTNTGYYLKKLLRPDVVISNDGNVSGKKHYDVFFRRTELFLILAEAANEIGGPTHKVDGISAFDALAAIRSRAGITNDDYLASIASKEDMRELIRNERRLELCFEGHRFWDLRRWKMNLNESVTAYFYNGQEYKELPAIKDRKFPEHAIYLPIHFREVLKYDLEQNQGW